ncbi:uncharacterized protein RAG0_05616 [Rhynchosporium agropyri]|uniref:Uncharacterized protein n=1 Tax=Rhynchosporium agropyri TaxID=914238 RepID=A0A1E1KE08_9HELO|nr:uncharacterized protein RAG0_05616 [Rhynchosporium agropyri]
MYQPINTSPTWVSRNSQPSHDPNLHSPYSRMLNHGIYSTDRFFFANKKARQYEWVIYLVRVETVVLARRDWWESRMGGGGMGATLSRFSSVAEQRRQNVEGESAGGMQREGNGNDSVGGQTSYTSLLRRCVAAYPTTPIPGKFLLDLVKSAF